MKCNLQNLFVLLLSCLSTCSAFFWNTQPASDPQQKALPLSYYRTYTYHPLTVQAPASYRFVPSTNNLFTPQMMAKSSPAGTFTAHTILAPTNLVQQTPSAQVPSVHPPPPAPSLQPNFVHQQQPNQVQPQQQQHHQQPPQHHQMHHQIPDMSGFHSMIQPSQPLPPQPMMMPQGQPQPIRQNHFYPENPFNQFQYMPPPPQYNMQQVQFVPCMCPVTLSLNPELAAPQVEKRVDESLAQAASSNIEPQQLIESNPIETKS